MATVTRREFWDRLELALYGSTWNTFSTQTALLIDALYDDLVARPAQAPVTRERELLRELAALVRGECPSLLNEDSGGDVRLSMAIDDALAAPPAAEELPRCDTCGRPLTKKVSAISGRIVCRACAAQAPPASDPPGLYRQGQEDMRRRVLDIVRDPSDCRIVKKLPIWGVPGMSEAAAAVAPLVERAQQATGGSDASDFRMRQSDPPGLVANWRPIETAPKRTDVLAGWADRPHWLPQVLQQDDAGMWFSGEESDYRPPTHWMPLPASPQAETKGDE